MVSYLSMMRVNIPEELRLWVAVRLLNAHLRSVKVMALGLLFNIAIIVAVLRNTISPTILAAFAIFTGGCAARKIWHASASSRKQRMEDPVRATKAMMGNSIAIAASMGAMAIYAVPQLAGLELVTLVVSLATQIGVAAYTTRTLPKAAYWHVALLTLGVCGGLGQVGTENAFAALVLVIAAALVHANVVQVAHKAFVDRILHERERNANADTVRMLLNEFESHASDWLFELDADQRLLAVSDRFAEAYGSKPEELNGREFLSLFVAGSARKELEHALEHGRPLRDATVQLVSKSGEKRWWDVSGRPLPIGSLGFVRFRGVVSDITAEKQAEARVVHMANFDSLTELPNRRMFNTTLSSYFNGEIDYSRLALLVIDCDNFKAINDVYGHPVGDEFLKKVATRLEQTLENSGLGGEGRLVARLGGDEFALLISGEDAADHSARLAETLVAAFHDPFEIKGHRIEGSVSVGIALAPDHAVCGDALLSNADIALYSAKDEGRDRWEMFQSGMDKAIQQRHSIANDLRSAVANGELRLFLQPLVNVETQRNAGFEALMRWEHPERGMVMPNDFIPVAEETGLIVQMGEWMIRTALAEAASWDEPFTIAINLSPLQLASPNLIPTTMNALGETGIDPGRVEFEITESVLLHNSEANIQVLNKLHSLGIKISLDDFGTGYASLNYLLTFPFDKIKIDRSFVNDMETRPEARAIVGAVIKLANQLGMCTLAEGVEHEAQLQCLRQEGCEMVQGWLFGKAMPADHYGAVKRVMSETQRAA